MLDRGSRRKRRVPPATISSPLSLAELPSARRSLRLKRTAGFGIIRPSRFTMLARLPRPFLFFALVSLFLIVSFFLYSSLDSNADTLRHAVRYDQNMAHVKEFERKLSGLEDELKANNKVVEEMRETLKKAERAKAEAKEQHEQIIRDLENRRKASKEVAEDRNVDRKVLPPPVEKPLESAKTPSPLNDTGVCIAHDGMLRPTGDVQMLDVYNVLPFDNPDGGVWKQGWEISYDKEEIKEEKTLEVVVIPHSHCDPGWIKTFEEYYDDQVQHILDNMVLNLQSKPEMKFIYAEMSFFERWWARQNAETRSKVRSLLKEGKFEIATGGWVMTDEANSHYFSIITELLEGHEFIRNNLDEGYKPQNHWSIDPFGLSPTLAHVLKESNLTHMVIQRVHYSVKKHLAKQKQLEFRWRQLWAGESAKTDITTHMFPFYSYDVPHTCGPDPKICCQFDFKRLPGGGTSCPWGVPPLEINSGNVARRAEMLADQYRKKSQLYKANVLLVPLGDDFRYDTQFEWDRQYENYKQLFEYMNKQKEWNINARFGTLHDYFNLLESRLQEAAGKEDLPILSGDFFTYADRDDHYWSGYFTSRPFYKRLDRTLQHYLRSAELLFSFAKNRLSEELREKLFSGLVTARRALSIFQHHDGVTGTAKDPVVLDYGSKMQDALVNCWRLIESATEALLAPSEVNLNYETDRKSAFFVNEKSADSSSLPLKQVIENENELVLFNSLTHELTEVVCLIVSSSDVSVHSADGVAILQQIGPFVEHSSNRLKYSENKFELCFEAIVKPLSLKRFDLKRGASVSKSKVYSSKGIRLDPFERAESLSFLSNDRFEARFDSSTGFLKSILMKDDSEVAINLSFVKYGARGHNPNWRAGGDDLSGAYLFLPDDDAKPLEMGASDYIVVDGPLRKKVFVRTSQEVDLLHTVIIDKHADFVKIMNEVDLTSTINFELAMRLESSVASRDEIYTDLNGIQMIRRKRFEKLPLQAHFYPMPGAAFIEDQGHRLSLFGAQALGVASLKSGWMEVMLDRRLKQDDGRGLFQGVLDNKRTISHFRLLAEPLSVADQKIENPAVGFHSITGHLASLGLHHPLVIMHGRRDGNSKQDAKESPSSFEAVQQGLPCDLHIVTLRTSSSPTDYSSPDHITRPSSMVGLIVHRLATDCRSKLKSKCPLTSNGVVNVSSLFVDRPKALHSSSLTMLYDGPEIADLRLEPMDLKTVKLVF
ncbi:hypothetical protein QR680_005439 [Steinernema hermaphroditum]|uniref:Alpha-mannosidase n=1 Tax=Steinernema hermaphroditum TaxID=289476 RepID=A0AA39HU99_9BILA|nr:hypothetical protein QR680_005439 [Steinernema hermaphroditum]